MNRTLSYVIGPETVLAIFTAVTFWLCARYNSGEGHDVEIMEKCVMLLPFVMVPPVFATFFVPGAKNWWWLGRAVLLTYVIMSICAGKFITGFGSGAKGQDAGFILVISFGTVLIALGTAIAGTMILAENKPGFAHWFREHKIIGTMLTILSGVPIGIAFVLIFSVGIAVFVGASSAFKH